MSHSLAGLVAASALLLVATGCGERAEPTGALVRVYPVTVYGAGDSPVVVDRAPQRIVTLAPGPAELLTALGTRHVETRPLVDSNGHILLRRLEAIRPDLIVASPTTDSVDLSHAQADTGAPVYVVPSNSIRDVENAANELGLLVDKPVAARRIVQAIAEKRRSVEARLAGTREVRVFFDAGFFTTVSDHSLVGDLIREAHGSNVAGASPEAGPFDLRELRRLDPDVYLAASDSSTSLHELETDARTRTLTAVREHRVGIVPAQLLEPGPRVGDGLEAIARLLHPDAFR